MMQFIVRRHGVELPQSMNKMLWTGGDNMTNEICRLPDERSSSCANTNPGPIHRDKV